MFNFVNTVVQAALLANKSGSEKGKPSPVGNERRAQSAPPRNSTLRPPAQLSIAGKKRKADELTTNDNEMQRKTQRGQSTTAANTPITPGSEEYKKLFRELQKLKQEVKYTKNKIKHENLETADYEKQIAAKLREKEEIEKGFHDLQPHIEKMIEENDTIEMSIDDILEEKQTITAEMNQMKRLSQTQDDMMMKLIEKIAIEMNRCSEKKVTIFYGEPPNSNRLPIQGGENVEAVEKRERTQVTVPQEEISVIATFQPLSHNALLQTILTTSNELQSLKTALHEAEMEKHSAALKYLDKVQKLEEMRKDTESYIAIRKSSIAEMELKVMEWETLNEKMEECEHLKITFNRQIASNNALIQNMKSYQKEMMKIKNEIKRGPSDVDFENQSSEFEEEDDEKDDQGLESIGRDDPECSTVEEVSISCRACEKIKTNPHLGCNEGLSRSMTGASFCGRCGWPHSISCSNNRIVQKKCLDIESMFHNF